MKINVFYSWQSDLPSNKNRSFIESCIKQAISVVYEKQKKISEIILESDSRNEIGTPDLSATIFNKIDCCDIFIADISLINPKTNERITPNPNVMIELGYATKTLGWSNILCIYNTEYGKIEELPFDIRQRKPISYNTLKDKANEKKNLTKFISESIIDIIENRIIDKKEFVQTKRQIDLGLQAILIDICSLLYKNKNDTFKYDYARLLNSNTTDIISLISDENFIGFEFYKNILLNINEFTDFFKDELETYFLSDKEKKLLAKIIYSLRNYKQIIMSDCFLDFKQISNEYKVIAGKDLNPTNPPNTYLLLKVIDSEKGQVISSGNFEGIDIALLLNIYSINNEMQNVYANCLYNIISIINDWIRTTGNYFIYNLRHLDS